MLPREMLPLKPHTPVGVHGSRFRLSPLLLTAFTSPTFYSQLRDERTFSPDHLPFLFFLSPDTLFRLPVSRDRLPTLFFPFVHIFFVAPFSVESVFPRRLFFVSATSGGGLISIYSSPPMEAISCPGGHSLRFSKFFFPSGIPRQGLHCLVPVGAVSCTSCGPGFSL